MKTSAKVKIIIGVGMLALVGAGFVLATGRQPERAQAPPTPPAPAVTEEATPPPAPAAPWAAGTAYAATNPKEWTIHAKLVVAYPKVKPSGEMATYAASPKLGGSKSQLEGDVGRAWPVEGLDVTVTDEEFIAQLEAKDAGFDYVIAHSAVAVSKDRKASLGGSTGWLPSISGPEWEYSYTLVFDLEPSNEPGWVKLASDGKSPLAWSTFAVRGVSSDAGSKVFGPPYLNMLGGTYGRLGQGATWSASGPSPGHIEKQEVLGAPCTVFYAIVPAEKEAE